MFTQFSENRRKEHTAQCRRFKRGQSYPNLFKSPIIPVIMVRISLKFIHTFPSDNPPRQPVPIITNAIAETKFSGN